MKTLLHTCCAPCANQCIEVLQTDGFDVTAYWYNPNIHPFTEYRSRRNCLRDYCVSIDLPLIERILYLVPLLDNHTHRTPYAYGWWSRVHRCT